MAGPRERATALAHGRPTIAIATFVRLMVVKQRVGWGYETLVREVSDSLHLRRFCLIALTERVPDESTVRKLVRRLGPEVVDEITREGRKLATRLRAPGARVVDRSRQIGKTVRSISRTLARRRGQRSEEVIAMNANAGRAMACSIREARRLAARARAAARSRGAQAKLRAARELDELADRCQRVATQIEQRLAGEKITNRMVSIADPDARPIRKGKLGKPNEFGYVAQIAEVTANTRRGARGYVLPAPSATGNAGENTLLATTVTELERLSLRPRELALDGAFGPLMSREQLAAVGPERVFVAGRHEPGSRRTRKTARPLPHRRRGSHQPPRTRLRPPERPFHCSAIIRVRLLPASSGTGPRLP